MGQSKRAFPAELFRVRFCQTGHGNLLAGTAPVVGFAKDEYIPLLSIPPVERTTGEFRPGTASLSKPRKYRKLAICTRLDFEDQHVKNIIFAGKRPLPYSAS